MAPAARIAVTVSRVNGPRLSCFFAVACLACGARTPLSDDSLAHSDAATDAATATDSSPPTVTLSIPLGLYPDCTSGTVTTRPHFVGGTGRPGTITLSLQGDSVVAALAFPTYASGSVAFVPTTAHTAGLRAAQSFDVQTANATFGIVTVAFTTGALSVVGQTLFLSTHGSAGGGDDISTFFHCRLPAGTPPTSIVTRAPPTAPLTIRQYGSCTASSSTDGPVQAGIAGGAGPIFVNENDTGLHLTWAAPLISALTCSDLDFGAAPSTATLTPGQSCGLNEPCGPPPTLGMSPYPFMATLTDMQGSMSVNGGVLFVHILGDAGAQACGVHDLSITCAGP